MLNTAPSLGSSPELCVSANRTHFYCEGHGTCACKGSKAKVSLWKAVAQCLHRWYCPRFHPSVLTDHLPPAPCSFHSPCSWRGEAPQHSMVKENMPCQSPYACTLKCTCAHTRLPGHLNTTRVELVFCQLDTARDAAENREPQLNASLRVACEQASGAFS